MIICNSAKLGILLLLFALSMAACSSDSPSQGTDSTDTGSGVSFPDVGVGNDTGGTLDDTGGTQPVFTCDDEDDFSPNHTPAEPYIVPSAGMDSEDLYLCGGFDDHYLVELQPGQGILARIEFAHRIGDLDLWLFPEGTTDESQALASSATDADLEEIEYTSEEGGRFLLLVDGFEDAVGFYDLTVRHLCVVDADCPCTPFSDCEPYQYCVLRGRYCEEVFEPGCGNDAFEPNNQMWSPYPLELASPSDTALLSGALCAEDWEYYLFELEDTADIRLELDFDLEHDLDVAVLDTEGEVVGYAGAGTIPEVLDLQVLAAGEYFIYVDTVAGGFDDIGYTLSITRGPADPCSENADCNTAPGRALCDSASGGCISFNPETPSGLGGACDSDDDCAEGTDGCYGGEGGFEDNFCTVRCSEDADCAELQDGGQCIPFGRRFGFCFPNCEVESDCPAPYSCTVGTASCDYVACGVDSDCEGDRACLRTDDDTPFCRTFEEVGCNGEAPDGNGRVSDATPLELDGLPLTGATICDADTDWYAIEVAGGPVTLDVSVSTTSGGGDLDLFVYDAVGRTLGLSASPDSAEEATVELVGPGTYTVRVNQYPGENGDVLTTYRLNVEVAEADPCESDADCGEIRPFRISCGQGGACHFLEGLGEVPLGSLCDSSDDCVEDAELCFTFDTAELGENICTRGCDFGEDECEDVPGAECVSLGGGGRFAMCLPPGE